jgi:hypothetical protein
VVEAHAADGGAPPPPNSYEIVASNLPAKFWYQLRHTIIRAGIPNWLRFTF